MKKIKVILMLGLFVSLLVLDHSGSASINTAEINADHNDDKGLESSQETELPDKVYTFFAPSHTESFNLYLKADTLYLIYIEIVTPHNVSKVKIDVYDPEGGVFEIFESAMTYFQDWGKFYEIPFGTVMSGNHEIQFIVDTEYNCNFLISITESVKALHDRMDKDDIDNEIFYRANKFGNTQEITHTVELKSDVDYSFNIGRINAVALTLDGNVSIDYTVYDSEDVDFIIYRNYRIKYIDETPTKFTFGTAIAGTYTIVLKVYTVLPEVEHTNLAYTVSEMLPLTEEKDVNNTKEPSKDGATKGFSLFNNNTVLPPLVIGGLTVTMIGIVAIVGVVVFRQKKRNRINLKL